MREIISPQDAADKPKPKAKSWNGTPAADTVALDMQAAAVAEFFRAAGVSPAAFFQKFDPLEVQPFHAFNATHGWQLGLQLIYCRPVREHWAEWIGRPLELAPCKTLQRHQPDRPDRFRRAVIFDVTDGLIAVCDGDRPQAEDVGVMHFNRDPKPRWWCIGLATLIRQYSPDRNYRAIMQRSRLWQDLDRRLPKRRRPRSEYPRDLDPLQYVRRSPGDAIYVRQACLQAVDHLPAALTLSQIAYWLTPPQDGRLPRARAELLDGPDLWWNNKYEISPKVWGLIASYDKLQDQTALSYEQIKDAMRRLRDGKWIVTRKIATRWRQGLEIIPSPKLQALVDRSRAGTLVPRALLGLMSLTQALVFCRLAWWFGNNPKGYTRAWSRRVRDTEVYHAAFSHAELAAQIGLGREQVRRAVEGLQKLGIVIAEPHLRGKAKVTHYRIDYEAFLRLWFSRFTQNT